MRIRKFIEFIKEEFTDTPEQYVDGALTMIKKKIDKMFDYGQDDISEIDGEEKSKSIRKAKEHSPDKDKMNFRDLGLRLDSSDLSKYSKLYDSVTIIFSDENNSYNLLITIDVADGINTEKDDNFSYKDIEKCYIKFKKYNSNFELTGPPLTKNVKIKDIDENFLIDLKIELDEMNGDEDSEDDDFEIETE